MITRYVAFAIPFLIRDAYRFTRARINQDIRAARQVIVAMTRISSTFMQVIRAHRLEDAYIYPSVVTLQRFTESGSIKVNIQPVAVEGCLFCTSLTLRALR
jgi:hypothetical protein